MPAQLQLGDGDSPVEMAPELHEAGAVEMLDLQVGARRMHQRNPSSSTADP